MPEFHTQLRQLEEHGKLIGVNAIAIYAHADLICDWLKNAAVPPEEVHVALPHSFKTRSLPKEMRLECILAKKEYHAMRRRHARLPPEERTVDIDDELNDAFAAQPPKAPAIIALYHEDTYNASPLCKPGANGPFSLDLYLGNLEPLVPADRCGMDVLLVNMAHDTTLANYRQFVRMDLVEEGDPKEKLENETTPSV